MTDARFRDLRVDAADLLPDLLKASVLDGAVATAAAVHLLVTAYNGQLLSAPPVRAAISVADGLVVVDWDRLRTLAHEVIGGRPNTPPDMVGFYQTGLPASSGHVLAAIAALGSGGIGLHEADVLAAAYQQVRLADRDWSNAAVDNDPTRPQVMYSVALDRVLAFRVAAAAAAAGVTPLDVIRKALQDTLPRADQTPPPEHPDGFARPEGL